MLVLHLNRSSFWGHTATKNSARVSYPELLDLTPYTTSGQLSTSPSLPLSTPHSTHSSYSSIAGTVLQHQQALSSASSAPTPQPAPLPSSSNSHTPSTPKVLYLLSAIVCHYGGHAFGHYICYRRKPRPMPSAVPNARLTLEDLSESGTGRGWLRLSDDIVDEVGIETVLSEQGGVFMAFYERVDAASHVPFVVRATDADQHGASNGAQHSSSYTSRELTLGLGGLSSLPSRASTPRVVHNVSAGIHTFSRPRTRETSPRPAFHPAVSEVITEDTHILSSSMDIITPPRASTLANELGKRAEGNSVANGESIPLRTAVGLLGSPSSSQASNDSAALAPAGMGHPSKRHRRRKGKSKGGS